MSFIVIAKRLVNAAEQIQTTEIAGPTLRIGRGTSNDLHLEDHTVQLNHAVTQQSGDRYVLRDLNSVSLTTVNDQPVTELTLPDRGEIRIGPYTLRFSQSGPGSPLTIEYEIPAETVRTQPAAQAESATGVAEGAPVGARAGRAARDEKVHLVASYRLGTRYINKTTITVVALVAVVGIAALASAIGKHQAFMPGSISVKHREKANQCSACHTVAWKPILTVVSNEACLSCHKPLAKAEHYGDRSLGPIPQCASCHSEHKGSAILAAMPDGRCVECHANLKAKEGGLRVEGKVHSFTVDHPEFAVTVARRDQPVRERIRLNDTARLEDTAAIKLNHKVHLKPDLPGSEGLEQLTCASCHQADAQGAYMRPIKYESDCMRCHLLEFDTRFPGKTVPHGKQMDEIAEFLRLHYVSYNIQTQKLTAPELNSLVERAQRFLIGKPDPKTKQGKCVLCHVLERKPEIAGSAQRVAVQSSGSEFPKILKTEIPERWLPYSIFSHASHLAEKFTGKSIDERCLKCHEAAPHSELTKDVLMPNVASCRKCHVEPSGVRAECTTCHVYHDKSLARRPAGEPAALGLPYGHPALSSASAASAGP
jgi:pSer/pThr/pTyr-binding forkhead associated (FHA) protein